MKAELEIRAYDGAGTLHSHDAVQLVLPIEGVLEIEVEGRGAQLSTGLAAFIPPEVRHTQAGLATNRSLVLDVPARGFPDTVLDRLARMHFFPPPRPLQSLIDYAALRCRHRDLGPEEGAALATLVVGALVAEPARSSIRAALAAEIRRRPATDWSVARLARVVHLSRSAPYRALAAEGEETPARFVTRVRLSVAMAALTEGRRTLAEIALSSGFADQAALTRAMRRETGRTPGAWRRAGRPLGTLDQ
ncbi:helix-turn-helix domain-containing protein [Thiocystis violacea]|uniref:helix-turn-helix domain-containing protein n=1 Tax=Thiocystis violacea TaxID=13725 RepID=UPI001906643A|nr:AraC family transcriptional regulator [Thiocystis violacea]MBK1724794.1 hypothetical protein [Thiocystis violacea]